MKSTYHARRLTPVLASLLVVAACTDGPTASSRSAPPAGAVTTQTTTVDQCTAQIDALIALTADATFLGQSAEKDEAGLIAKLTAAQQALQLGKGESAVQKLTDFRTKVTALGAQGKLNADDAAALTAGADEAIFCIQNIGAGA